MQLYQPCHICIVGFLNMISIQYSSLLPLSLDETHRASKSRHDLRVFQQFGTKIHFLTQSYIFNTFSMSLIGVYGGVINLNTRANPESSTEKTNNRPKWQNRFFPHLSRKSRNSPFPSPLPQPRPETTQQIL